MVARRGDEKADENGPGRAGRARLIFSASVFAVTLAVWILMGGAIPALAAPLAQTQNILILGSDERSGEASWNTDMIMVAAVDWNRGEIALLSIPRDLYVEIPGAGWNRINTADCTGEALEPSGGPKLVSRVLSNTMGIRAQNYVRLKMPAFAGMIDAMGGITITLDAPFHERSADETQPSHWSTIDLPEGKQHLDGHTALLYVRARSLTDDFDRMRRQQQVVWAMRDRVKELNWLVKIPELWSAWNELVETDLTLWDMISLAGLGNGLTGEQVHARTLDAALVEHCVTPGGGQVLCLREREKLARWLETLFDADASQAAPY